MANTEEQPKSLREQLDESKEENLKLMRDYIASRSTPLPKPEDEFQVVVYAFFSELQPKQEYLLGSLPFKDGAIYEKTSADNWIDYAKLTGGYNDVQRVYAALKSGKDRWANIHEDGTSVNLLRWRKEEVCAADQAAQIMADDNEFGYKCDADGCVIMDNGTVVHWKEIRLAVPAKELDWWSEYQLEKQCKGVDINL